MTAIQQTPAPRADEHEGTRCRLPALLESTASTRRGRSPHATEARPRASRWAWRRAVFALSGPALALACSAGGGSTSGSAGSAGSAGDPSGAGAAGAGGTSGSGTTAGTSGIVIPVGGAAGSAGQTACAVGVLGKPGDNPGANFSEWLAARGPVVDRYLPGPDLEGLTADTLAHYQVLMLDQLPEGTTVGVSPEELQAWIAGGGRLIALSGYSDNATAPAVTNALLEPTGLAFATDRSLWGPVTTFAPHPITVGLTSLTFVGGREVTHLDGDEVLMTLNDPPIAVGVAATRDAGKVFVFGDEWITYDSEWAAIPEIEQFWFNIFSWFGGCELTPVIIK